MTTLNEFQKSAIGLSMSKAWNAADYDHAQIPLDSDLTVGWESLSHAKLMHLRHVAHHLVRYLVDDEIITFANDDQDKYEVVGNVSDYEKGDWARVTDDDGVYEFLVTDVSPWSVEGASISRRVKPGRRFERAPKPVEHPDPEAHKYIVDHEDHDRIYEAKWDANYLEDRYYMAGRDIGVPPRLFSDWSAVKFVPVEEED